MAEPGRTRPSLRARVLRVFLLCSSLYLVACAGCAGLQRRMIYFPPVLTSEQTDSLARQERFVRWKDTQGKTIGWQRRSAVQPAQGQVLVLHGNASCAFHASHYADPIQLAAPLDVFVVEFPGYADRPGSPTERTIEQAAEQGLAALPEQTPTYLVGESLGTGVAGFLAGRHPEKIAGVVLLAPYCCLAHVGQAHVKILPVHLLLRDRFPTEDYLKNYHHPLAVLLGGHDTVVPARFGRRLYDGYPGPKRVWEFPEATHDSLMSQPPEIWKEIIAFWQSDSSKIAPSLSGK